MYKHLKKMTIAVIIWAVIACIFIMPCIVLWGFSIFGDFSDLKEALATRITCIILAIAMTVPFVMFWIKMVQLLVINHMNNLFEADADGFVPVSELAKEMGRSEEKVIRKVNNAIRKGYIVNVNYSAAQKAFLLSDKITDLSATRFKGQVSMSAVNPFVGVNCPTCAAALKIRANTEGTCPFCGRTIIASYSAPESTQQ